MKLPLVRLAKFVQGNVTIVNSCTIKYRHLFSSEEHHSLFQISYYRKASMKWSKIQIPKRSLIV